VARDEEKPAQRTVSVPVEGAPEGAAAEAVEQRIADLPDIESLNKDSDYTGFLREGIPEQLKNQALRKLWRSDPVLANLDGLNDYDEDFTKIFTKAVTESVKTLFKVGKGMAETEGGETEEAEKTGTADVEPADESSAVADAAETDGRSRERDAREADDEADAPPPTGSKRNA
jgi:hypothetical protein